MPRRFAHTHTGTHTLWHTHTGTQRCREVAGLLNGKHAAKKCCIVSSAHQIGCSCLSACGAVYREEEACALGVCVCVGELWRRVGPELCGGGGVWQGGGRDASKAFKVLRAEQALCQV